MSTIFLRSFNGNENDDQIEGAQGAGCSQIGEAHRR
jgi:hypothetical protein